MHYIVDILYQTTNNPNKKAVTLSKTGFSTLSVNFLICECNQIYPSLTKTEEGKLNLPIETTISSFDNITILFVDYLDIIHTLKDLRQFDLCNIHEIAHSIYCPLNNGGCQ